MVIIGLIVASVAIFFISIAMAMEGRYGGNFYVPLFVALGLPIHQVATTIEIAEKIAKEKRSLGSWVRKKKRANEF